MTNDMARRLYPTSLNELDSWRAIHKTTLDEARKRFVQFVVLESIASASWGHTVAFKGGNALRFIYQNPRSTVDLDFSASAEFPDDPEKIRMLLDPTLQHGGRRFGLKLRSQKIRREPSGLDKTMPTYDVTIAFQVPGDRYYADFETTSRNYSSVVVLEVSINDIVCETRSVRLVESTSALLRVCILEDIIAEKLRALLQQRIRNRYRRQDVYDIARMVRQFGPELNRDKLAQFLDAKARARDIQVRKEMFDEEIKRRAVFEYEYLFDSLDPDFIPFEDAWQEVVRLVDELRIPD